jgi:hypothetical protein
MVEGLMMNNEQESLHNGPIAQFRRQLSAHFSNDLPFEAVDLTESELMLSDFDFRLRPPWLSGRHGAGSVRAGRSSGGWPSSKTQRTTAITNT